MDDEADACELVSKREEFDPVDPVDPPCAGVLREEYMALMDIVGALLTENEGVDFEMTMPERDADGEDPCVMIAEPPVVGIAVGAVTEEVEAEVVAAADVSDGADDVLSNGPPWVGCGDLLDECPENGLVSLPPR